MKRPGIASIGLLGRFAVMSARAARTIRSTLGRTFDRIAPSRWCDPSAAARRNSCQPTCSYRWSTAPITVLVPVHNAKNEVEQCLAALLANTPPSANVIILDDASTEPGLTLRLAAAAEAPNVTVVRNPENIGFARTINRGIALAGDHDVVFLNSDTEVTPRWLTYLRSAAYERDDIGTATALSNSASQFSVPFRFHNGCPYWMDLPAYARSIAQLDGTTTISVPFGHGFCLYVKRRYIDAIGLLDSDAFARGYGEEVDFCLRGSRAGWSHVLSTKAFVYHVNAASFGASKQRLKTEARLVLNQRYPEYGSLLRLNSRNPAITELRQRVAQIWTYLSPALPRKLWVVSTPAAAAQLLDRLSVAVGDGSFNPASDLVLWVRGGALRLSGFRGAEPHLIAEGQLIRAPDPFSPYGLGYEDLVGRWLVQYAVDSIEVRGMRGHGVGLVALAQHLELPVSLLIDDDFPICPTVSLHDEKGLTCGGRCTPTEGECLAGEDKHRRRLKHQYIKAWQKAYQSALLKVDFLAVDSDARRAVLTDAFGDLAGREVLVAGADTVTRSSCASEVERHQLKVGVISVRSPKGIDRHLHQRVLSSLTAPELRDWIQVVMVDPGVYRPTPMDVAILSLEPSLTLEDAERLRRSTIDDGIPFILDLDASVLSSVDRLERPNVLNRVLSAATEIWADAVPAALPGPIASKTVHVPTSLNRRLWPASIQSARRSPDGPVRLLFIADQASATDVNTLLHAIDEMAESSDIQFELVLVRLHGSFENRRWLTQLRVPSAAFSYPLFMHWLGSQGPFDIGILPTAEDGCRRMSSVLEYTALGAVPVKVFIPSQPATPVVPRGIKWRLATAAGPTIRDTLEREMARVDAAQASGEETIPRVPVGADGTAAATITGTRLRRYL